jgi:GT2 family glycosyltransferase
MSVVVCSLNGADGIARALTAIGRQTIAARLEVVVVDDGSTDGTAARARALGATVVSHQTNRGYGAARNTGVAASSAEIVAFVDDDCAPDEDWAARLLASYDEPGVAAVAGAVLVDGPPSFMIGYLTRHNPAQPLELDLARSSSVPYRFWRYLARSWGVPPRPVGRRRVFAAGNANLSFRRTTLEAIGGFDDSMRLGAEDLDACMRTRAALGDSCLLFEPSAVVRHHFSPELRDTLRRSRSYGRGQVRLFAKHQDLTPTVFPLPLALVPALMFARRRPISWVVVLVLPHLVRPRGLLDARRAPAAVLDAYVACLQEAAYDLGLFEQALRWSQARRRRLAGSS